MQCDHPVFVSGAIPEGFRRRRLCSPGPSHAPSDRKRYTKHNSADIPLKARQAASNLLADLG